MRPTVAVCAALVAATALAPRSGASAVAVPAYVSSSASWSGYAAAAPTVGMMILNPASGPGPSASTTTADRIAEAHRSGAQVLGYVYTRYTRRDVDEVKSDIDRYFAWYDIDGIFIDSVPVTCPEQPYYQGLYNYVKAKSARAIVTLNPGWTPGECYMPSSDVIVSFDGPWSNYQSFTAPAWAGNYDPNRFWHLVYGVPADSRATAIAYSRQRHAGWIYVTPDVPPNPWDAPPPDAYWANELSEVQPFFAWLAVNDATTISYELGVNGSPAAVRVYIDRDKSATTGYKINGIGADYAVDNARLLRYSSGTWIYFRDAVVTRSGHSVEITVSRSDVGATGAKSAAYLVFETVGASGRVDRSSRYVQAYTPSNKPVSRYGAGNDTTRVYFESKVTAPYTDVCVWIDADRNAHTGITVGNRGAEFLIDNGSLYRASGGSWIHAGDAHMSQSGNTWRWWVWRREIGKAGFTGQSETLLFGGRGQSASYTSPAYTHSLTDY